ncbi:MAG: rhodanese-like domain-containing protein [Vicinamibacteria bacterium]
MRTRTSPKYATAAALLAIALASPAAAQTTASQKAAAQASVPMPKTDRMPMAEFKALLAKGDVVIIDVRSADAYAGGHIPGALSIPEESITSATAEKLKRMGRPIATYCS